MRLMMLPFSRALVAVMALHSPGAEAKENNQDLPKELDRLAYISANIQPWIDEWTSCLSSAGHRMASYKEYSSFDIVQFAFDRCQRLQDASTTKAKSLGMNNMEILGMETRIKKRLSLIITDDLNIARDAQ